MTSFCHLAFRSRLLNICWVLCEHKELVAAMEVTVPTHLASCQWKLIAVLTMSLCGLQVCNSGEINQKKIGSLVGAYVKKMRACRSK